MNLVKIGSGKGKGKKAIMILAKCCAKINRIEKMTQ